ncbi:hypothetical protein ACWGID_09440 [Kribbella sp. NPDC054772]
MIIAPIVTVCRNASSGGGDVPDRLQRRADGAERVLLHHVEERAEQDHQQDQPVGAVERDRVQHAADHGSWIGGRCFGRQWFGRQWFGGRWFVGGANRTGGKLARGI